jgi:hypothetical protein
MQNDVARQCLSILPFRADLGNIFTVFDRYDEHFAASAAVQRMHHGFLTAALSD